MHLIKSRKSAKQILVHDLTKTRERIKKRGNELIKRGNDYNTCERILNSQLAALTSATLTLHYF